ncbi:prepilin peptidase [Knoellia subterranea]|uniref:Peptidase n=1 Tax=Knoellia subterranea KCTC 19937 TaxID=1385521 RepID=A0A0A0JRS3_9MICO|nr:A24 family peptidase [Knoellia subterranea]KGN38306.1 peptidase [Knoellia subterranea KCTC 19937]
MNTSTMRRVLGLALAAGAATTTLAVAGATTAPPAQAADGSIRVIAGVIAAVLMVVSAIDLDVRRLPDRFTLPLIPATAAGLAVVALVHGDLSNWLRAVLAGLAVGAIHLGLAFIGGGTGLGLGDVKLSPTLGMLLGWHSWTLAFAGVFLAFVLGGLVGVGLIVIARRDRKSTVPFGPFMVAGCLALLAAPAVSAFS